MLESGVLTAGRLTYTLVIEALVNFLCVVNCISCHHLAEHNLNIVTVMML